MKPTEDLLVMITALLPTGREDGSCYVISWTMEWLDEEEDGYIGALEVKDFPNMYYIAVIFPGLIQGRLLGNQLR